VHDPPYVMQKPSIMKNIIAIAGIMLANMGYAQRPALLGASDVNALPSAAADARIPYGDGPEQFGDLRLPKGKGPFPVAIVIHGGCWVHSYADIQNSTALADALRDAGIATWNIEYRRMDDPGGGWPGTFTDVADAADHLRELAKQYPLDLKRVIAIGHSAGGHLAFWLAARHRFPSEAPFYTADPLKLVGVISLAGPPDLQAFIGQDAHSCGGPVVAKLLGDAQHIDQDRLKAASPAAWLPLGMPQRLIVGQFDFVMTPALSSGYVAQAVAAGDDAQYLPIPGVGHFELIAPHSAAGPTVLGAALDLLHMR